MRIHSVLPMLAWPLIHLPNTSRGANSAAMGLRIVQKKLLRLAARCLARHCSSEQGLSFSGRAVPPCLSPIPARAANDISAQAVIGDADGIIYLLEATACYVANILISEVSGVTQDYLIRITDKPSWVPADDEVVLDTDSNGFVEGFCKPYIADRVEKLGYRYGNSLLTWSNQYGLIWRVDRIGPDYREQYRHPDDHTVSRDMMWRLPGSINECDGTASIGGQDMPPL